MKAYNGIHVNAFLSVRNSQSIVELDNSVCMKVNKLRSSCISVSIKVRRIVAGIPASIKVFGLIWISNLVKLFHLFQYHFTKLVDIPFFDRCYKNRVAVRLIFPAFAEVL